MKKKILILQSIPIWLSIFKDIIRLELPGLYGDIFFLDSFDEAIDTIPLDCELIVISSDMFYDNLSKYREFHGAIIPDEEKDGAKFAEMVKSLNPNSKVYIFSQYEPKQSKFIDGFILKHQHGNIYSSDIVKVLQKI